MPEGHVQYVVKDESGAPAYYVFSTKGDKQPQAAFEDAFFNKYLEGQKAEGFTVLSAKGVEGLQAKLRSGFEGARSFVGKELQGADETMVQFGNAVRTLLGKEGNVTTQDLPLPAKGITENIIRNPSDLGMAVGLGGASAATRSISGLLPILARMGGAVAGQNVAETLTGDIQQKGFDSHVSDALVTSAVVAIPEGAFGVIGRVFGKNLSRRAQEQVSEEVLTLIREKYPQLANQGSDALKAIVNTQQGLTDIARIGVKALKADSDVVANQLILNMQQFTPQALSKGQRKEFHSLFVKLSETSDKYLESSSLNEAREITKEINKVFVDIQNKVLKEFPRMKSDAYGKVIGTFEEFSKSLQSLTEGAEVINALKASTVKGKGFDVRKFQEYVSERTGSNLFENVATAAGRGVRGGIDETLSVGLSPKIPFVGRVTAKIPIAGTRFVGVTKGAIPDVGPMTSVVINKSIQDYLKGD